MQKNVVVSSSYFPPPPTPVVILGTISRQDQAIAAFAESTKIRQTMKCVTGSIQTMSQIIDSCFLTNLTTVYNVYRLQTSLPLIDWRHMALRSLWQHQLDLNMLSSGLWKVFVSRLTLWLLLPLSTLILPHMHQLCSWEMNFGVLGQGTCCCTWSTFCWPRQCGHIDVMSCMADVFQIIPRLRCHQRLRMPCRLTELALDSWSLKLSTKTSSLMLEYKPSDHFIRLVSVFVANTVEQYACSGVGFCQITYSVFLLPGKQKICSISYTIMLLMNHKATQTDIT